MRILFGSPDSENGKKICWLGIAFGNWTLGIITDEDWK